MGVSTYLSAHQLPSARCLVILHLQL